MENKEAIEALRDLMYTTQDYPLLDGMTMFGEALTLGISALEKQEQDRWIPVVRCRDCKFRENDDFCTGRGFPYQLVPDDGFCDKGERKE